MEVLEMRTWKKYFNGQVFGVGVEGEKIERDLWMGEVCRVICNSEVLVDEKSLRGTRVGLSA